MTVLEDALTLEDGSEGSVPLCNLPAGELAIDLQVGGGYWAEETSWEIVNATDGEVAMAGGVGHVSSCAGSCGTRTVQLNDDHGDGWNGNFMTVSDCCGNVLDSMITLTGGSSNTVDLCLPNVANNQTAPGVTISVGGGTWADEVSWQLQSSSGKIAAPGSVAGTGVLGERAAVCKPATDLHEVSCCSDDLLPGFAQMHALCPFAASNLSAAGGPGCTSDASFAVAAATCAAVGARLCSPAEMKADCAAGTGCGFDSDLVWTGEPCTLAELCTMELSLPNEHCSPFISEVAEGSNNNKYIEIYNPTDLHLDLGRYGFAIVTDYPTAVGGFRV